MDFLIGLLGRLQKRLIWWRWKRKMDNLIRGGLKIGTNVVIEPDVTLDARSPFLIEIGEQGYLIKIIEGRIVSITPGPFVTPNYSFALRAPRDEWEMFWKKVPAPGHNDIFALFKRGKLKIEGDLHPFMANLLYIKDVLAAPRKEAA